MTTKLHSAAQKKIHKKKLLRPRLDAGTLASNIHDGSTKTCQVPSSRQARRPEFHGGTPSSTRAHLKYNSFNSSWALGARAAYNHLPGAKLPAIWDSKRHRARGSGTALAKHKPASVAKWADAGIVLRLKVASAPPVASHIQPSHLWEEVQRETCIGREEKERRRKTGGISHRLLKCLFFNVLTRSSSFFLQILCRAQLPCLRFADSLHTALDCTSSSSSSTSSSTPSSIAPQLRPDTSFRLGVWKPRD